MVLSFVQNLSHTLMDEESLHNVYFCAISWPLHVGLEVINTYRL